jgi:hypothetical protein
VQPDQLGSKVYEECLVRRAKAVQLALRVLRELKVHKDQSALRVRRDHRAPMVRKVQLDLLDCEVRVALQEPLAVLVRLDRWDLLVMWVLLDQQDLKVWLGQLAALANRVPEAILGGLAHRVILVQRVNKETLVYLAEQVSLVQPVLLADREQLDSLVSEAQLDNQDLVDQ